MQTNRNKFSRRYDREFKQNAVALIQSGRSITEVSRDVGVSDWSLRQWLKTIEGDQALNERWEPLAEREGIDYAKTVAVIAGLKGLRADKEADRKKIPTRDPGASFEIQEKMKIER